MNSNNPAVEAEAIHDYLYLNDTPKHMQPRGRYINKKGLVVSTDGTTIKDRKPKINLALNHKKYDLTPVRVYVNGQWYVTR